MRTNGMYSHPYLILYSVTDPTQWCVGWTPVAVRLADGDKIKIATAGKPDCYTETHAAHIQKPHSPVVSGASRFSS